MATSETNVRAAKIASQDGSGDVRCSRDVDGRVVRGRVDNLSVAVNLL